MKRFVQCLLVLVLGAACACGQAIAVNAGAIEGTITDPSGAAVPNASITVTNPDTGFQQSLQTDSAGLYNIVPLTPGNYNVRVAAPGFTTLSVSTVVRTGTATSGNFKLQLGLSTETVEVTAGAVQTNTEQAGVSDVITREQIESLPVQGRNFLDLAQIEPGVVLQSGESFDPTKAGYSALSIGGVSGRTTRILLDGQDITDEFVGTTIFNVSQGAVDEFQLNRANQDVSGEVTSTGQVLVATRSGTNQIHGNLFYYFQDKRAGFANTAGGLSNPFQRNQFGGSVGGPIWKDKLFFFGNSERIKQDQSQSILLGSLFQAIQQRYSSLPSPYRETYSTIRLDYNGPWTGHYFVRVNYDVNASVSNFNAGYELYSNRDNTPGIAGGADFSRGHFTHSFRGSYEKFHNLIVDATAGNSSIYLGIPGLNFRFVAQNLFSGPNVDAPQGTFQSDKQFRYDGTFTFKSHNLKYGYNLNRILSAAFANFFALGPRATINSATLLANCNNTAGAAPCPTDPIHGYFPTGVRYGNGLGFSTEKSAFGLAGGGLDDWREGAYFSDSWKARPDLTIVAGVRWSVDTGRANQDVPAPLCSDIVTGTGSIPVNAVPCTGGTSLFSQFGSQFSGSTNTPYANFAPQLGFNFAPGDHKTTFRAAFGIFFEGDVFNNASNSRTPLLRTGLFINDSQTICGGVNSLTLPNGMVQTTINGRAISDICAQSLATGAPYYVALNQQYAAATLAAGPSVNGNFVGRTLFIPTGSPVYAARYRTPYAEQWNGGVQRELFKGGVVSVDYIHSSTLKIGETIDANHVGAARFFNATAAQAAVAATLTACGASTVAAALVNCPKFTSTANPAGRSATINDFAARNLDSGNVANGGRPASTQPSTSANPNPAFPGANPLFGAMNFILPAGRSGYDALEVVFREQRAHPARGILTSNFQVAYTWSRVVTTANSQNAGDQFFTATPYDQDYPARFIGPGALDHTHELSFGGSFRPKWGPQIGLIGHYYSPPPADLFVPTPDGSATAAIFKTDFTGDGLVNDLVPGTNPGYYMRRFHGNSLNNLINFYNSNYAGQLTPAGQALVSAGIFTQAQMRSLGAVTPTLALAPTRAIENQSFRTVDLNLSYPINLGRFHEGLSLEPAIAFYNVGNFSNFQPFAIGATGAGLLTGGPGSFNGPNATVNGFNANLESVRTQRGSGTFNQGAPRTLEYELKLNF